MFYRTPDHDPGCNRCSLSTGKSVHSHSQVPFDQVLLAIYAAYPAEIEEEKELSLYPNGESLKMNAGQFLKNYLSLVFDYSETSFIKNQYKPFRKYVLYGNALRCKPLTNKGEKKAIKHQHRIACKYWLDLDINSLNPRVPILVSGSEAVKSFFGSDASLKAYRGTVHYYGQHPVVVCENFVHGSTYHTFEPQSYYKDKSSGLDIPTGEAVLVKPIPGDPVWMLANELKLVRTLVEEYIQDMETN